MHKCVDFSGVSFAYVSVTFSRHEIKTPLYIASWLLNVILMNSSNDKVSARLPRWSLSRSKLVPANVVGLLYSVLAVQRNRVPKYLVGLLKIDGHDSGTPHRL